MCRRLWDKDMLGGGDLCCVDAGNRVMVDLQIKNYFHIISFLYVSFFLFNEYYTSLLQPFFFLLIHSFHSLSLSLLWSISVSISWKHHLLSRYVSLSQLPSNHRLGIFLYIEEYITISFLADSLPNLWTVPAHIWDHGWRCLWGISFVCASFDSWEVNFNRFQRLLWQRAGDKTYTQTELYQ